MKAKTKYWVGLIGAMVVGGLLALTPAPHWVVMLFCLPPRSPLEELLRKLGDALFIAGVLALLVDTALKEKLLTEFAHDISVHIIGEFLPLSLRDRLRRYLETSFVRTEWMITCVIEPHDDPKYVLLSISSEYSVENRARGKQNYPFGVKVERSWYTQYEHSIESLDFGEGPIEKSKLVLDTEHYQADEHGNIVYTRPVEITPAAPGVAPKKFRADIVQHYWEHAFSPFYALALVMTTTVIVKAPRGQFKVELDLTFSENVPDPTHGIDRGFDVRTWVLEEPMLPGQGFFVRWTRV